MRAGNGRHRRPRQAPAFVVTAGVTGAGMALPLFAASAAHAAGSGTWDRVAQCESGGLWSANSGNGYYGGLQLTLRSWKSHGGTEYAARPDLASRSEQIAVAEKILGTLGPEAWPACSASSGLTEESTRAPDIDPGVPDHLLGLPTSPPPPSPGTPPGHTTGPDARTAPDTPEDDASPGGDTPAGSAAEDTGTSGAAGHRTEDGADTDRKATDSGGRHRGDTDTRGDGAGHASRGRHGRPELPGDTADAHTVRPGETLSALAEEHHLAGGWPALYAANRRTVGDDPDLILPGQVLNLRMITARRDTVPSRSV